MHAHRALSVAAFRLLGRRQITQGGEMRLHAVLTAAGLAAVILVALLTRARGGELGEPVRFRKGHAVAVGGLTIEYVGERHVEHPVFKPGFTFHDFKVSDGRETATVAWSSGTGVIGPQEFKLGGVEYQLELRHSIARDGWLGADELVLWRAADYAKAAAARQHR